MFRNIRTSIGNFHFRNELAKIHRERRLTSLPAARSVGILYELNEVEDYDTIAAFVAKLQQDHKEVKALGFVKSKVLQNRFLPKLSFDFFSPKDLNWYYKPGHLKVNDFMHMDFDLMINFSLKDNLSLKYIAGLSSARCRIGRFSEKNKSSYDLMITLPAGSGLQKFIDEVTHYLTVINNGDNK